MKKNILIFGLISGLIVTAVMVTTAISCYKSGQFEGSMVMGFGAMIIAFSFIFVAVKSYRDQQNGGLISFTEALKIGLWISFIGSTMYVLCWLVVYYKFYPNYMEKFIAHSVAAIKAEGLSPAETKEKIEGITKYQVWYRSPILVVLLTYMEVFPIGLLVSIISALFLKRKNKPATV